MHSRAGCDHRQHGRRAQRSSAAGGDRSRRGFRCDADHVADRSRRDGSVNGKRSRTGPAGSDGALAIVVLLVIMNWFFHKIYWGGWIRAHNRRRKALLANANAVLISQRRLYWGFVLLGFTSLYREGFEV